MPESRKEYLAKWRAANLEKAREYERKYYEKNKDAVIARATKRVSENREEHNKRCLEYHKKNPQVGRAVSASRRAKLLQATPPWADVEKIKEIYKEAKLRELDGEKWHVDHIIPLKNDTVCGLHCEANLRIIPAKDNLSKHNKLIEHGNE